MKRVIGNTHDGSRQRASLKDESENMFSLSPFFLHSSILLRGQIKQRSQL